MNANEVLRRELMMTCDKLKAGVHDVIRRSGDDAMCLYATKLGQEMKSEDPKEILKSHLALYGLLVGWSELLGKKPKPAPVVSGRLDTFKNYSAFPKTL